MGNWGSFEGITPAGRPSGMRVWLTASLLGWGRRVSIEHRVFESYLVPAALIIAGSISEHDIAPP
jgi:hypothetical protein